MRLNEVFETENTLYFVLDLMEGGELENTIDQKHSPKEIKAIMKGLFKGV